MGAATEPIINILGELVALGPLAREHIPLFARWGNDFAVARTFGGQWVAWRLCHQLTMIADGECVVAGLFEF